VSRANAQAHRAWLVLIGLQSEIGFVHQMLGLLSTKIEVNGELIQANAKMYLREQMSNESICLNNLNRDYFLFTVYPVVLYSLGQYLD